MCILRNPSPVSCPFFDDFNQALARDGYWCMVTGRLDLNSVRHCQALGDEAEREHITVAMIETAHILNESTMQGIDPEGTGKDATANEVQYFHRVPSVTEPSILLTRYLD